MNTQPVRIALIGDYSPAVTAHRAIDASFQLAGEQLPLVAHWRHTSTLTRGQGYPFHEDHPVSDPAEWLRHPCRPAPSSE